MSKTTVSPPSIVKALLVQFREHGQAHSRGKQPDEQCRNVLSKLRSRLPLLEKYSLNSGHGSDIDAASDFCALIELLARGCSCPNSPAVFSYGAPERVLPTVVRLLSMTADPCFVRIRDRLHITAQCLLTLVARRSARARLAVGADLVRLLHALRDGATRGGLGGGTDTPTLIPCFDVLRSQEEQAAGARPPYTLVLTRDSGGSCLSAALSCEIVSLVPALLLDEEAGHCGDADHLSCASDGDIDAGLSQAHALCGVCAAPWWPMLWQELTALLEASDTPPSLRLKACGAVDRLLCEQGGGQLPEAHAQQVLFALSAALAHEARRGVRRAAFDGCVARALAVLARPSPYRLSLLEATGCAFLIALDATLGSVLNGHTATDPREAASGGSLELVMRVSEVAELLLDTSVRAHAHQRVDVLLDAALRVPSLLPLACRCLRRALADNRHAWPERDDILLPLGCCRGPENDAGPDPSAKDAAAHAAKRKAQQEEQALPQQQRAPVPDVPSPLSAERTPSAVVAHATKRLVHLAVTAVSVRTRVPAAPSTASESERHNRQPSSLTPLMLALELFHSPALRWHACFSTLHARLVGLACTWLHGVQPLLYPERRTSKRQRLDKANAPRRQAGSGKPLHDITQGLAMRAVPPDHLVSAVVDALLFGCAHFAPSLAGLADCCQALARGAFARVIVFGGGNDRRSDESSVDRASRISVASSLPGLRHAADVDLLPLLSLPAVARQCALLVWAWRDPTLRAIISTGDTFQKFVGQALSHPADAVRLHTMRFLPSLLESVAPCDAAGIAADWLPCLASNMLNDNHRLRARQSGGGDAQPGNADVCRGRRVLLSTLADIVSQLSVALAATCQQEVQADHPALVFSYRFWSLCDVVYPTCVRVAMIRSIDVVARALGAKAPVLPSTFNDPQRDELATIVRYLGDDCAEMRRAVSRAVVSFAQIAQPVVKGMLLKMQQDDKAMVSQPSQSRRSGGDVVGTEQQRRVVRVRIALMDATGSLGCLPDTELSVGSVMTLVDLWTEGPGIAANEIAWVHIRRICAARSCSFQSFCDSHAAMMYPRVIELVLDRLGPAGIEMLVARMQTPPLSPIRGAGISSSVPQRIAESQAKTHSCVNLQNFLRSAMPFALPHFVLHQKGDHMEELAVVYRAAFPHVSNAGDLLVEYLDSILVQVLLRTKADERNLADPLGFLARAIGVTADSISVAQKLFRFNTNYVLRALAQKLSVPSHFYLVARSLGVVAAHTFESDICCADDTKLDILLRNKFLAMSQHVCAVVEQPDAPVHERRQALHAFERLLRLLGRLDKSLIDHSEPNKAALDPFVPKIMTTLTSALQESGLRRDACSAWGSFVALLSPQALATTLPPIVVSLYPVAIAEAAEIIGRADHDVTPAQSMGGVLHGEGDAGGRCGQTAITILSALILGRKNEIRAHFKSIPPLTVPDEMLTSGKFPPALRKVVSELNSANATVTLIPQLEQLTNLIGHESRQVRCQAASQLVCVLHARSSELLDSICGRESIPEAVSQIVMRLLQRMQVEQDNDIKDNCAKALGAIGALDIPPSCAPARARIHGSAVAKVKKKENGELSDHDLAFVVLQRHLIPLLRDAASSSAGSVSKVCYAVQELLRFLGRAGPQVDSTTDDDATPKLVVQPDHSATTLSPAQELGAFPDWLRQQLSKDRDGAELVEPYWSSSFCWDESVVFGQDAQSARPAAADESSSTSAAGRADKALFNRATSFESWVSSWAKALAKLASGRQLQLFKACISAVQYSAPLAEQLLPYLVRNVLQNCIVLKIAKIPSPPVAVEPRDSRMMLDEESASFCAVHVELMAVLDQKAATTNTMPASQQAVVAHALPASSSWLAQRCTQALFAMLDTLAEWDAFREHASSAAAAAASSRRSKKGSTSGGSKAARSPTAMDSDGARVIKALLTMLNTGRYPALLAEAACRCNADARALQYFERFLRVKYSEESHRRSGADTWDGAVTVGQLLEREELERLHRLHAAIEDDPDSGGGLLALRRSGASKDHPLSLEEQILHHESAFDWSEAQLCYEQILNSCAVGDGKRSTSATSKDHSDCAGAPNYLRFQRGLVRCHMQQGHLETALRHVQGVCSRAIAAPSWHGASVQRPGLSREAAANVLGSYAVEAAWRLGHWQHLSAMVRPDHMPTASTQSNQGARLPQHMSSETDVQPQGKLNWGYEMHVGELFLALKERDTQRFNDVARSARLEIAGALAAASSESYARAYPLLLRLHTLHELSDAFSLLTCTAPGYEMETHTELALSATRCARWTKHSDWDRRLDLLSPSTLLRGDAQLVEVRGSCLRELRLAVARQQVLSGDKVHQANVAAAVRHAAVLERDHWLGISRAARAGRNFRTASSALLRATAAAEIAAAEATRAEQLVSGGSATDRRFMQLSASGHSSSLLLLIERATLLKEQGKLEQALMELEPVEINVKDVLRRYGVRQPESPTDKANRADIARKLLLSTTWAQEHGLKAGHEVLDRLKAVTQIRDDWEDGYFALGQYYDKLFGNACENAHSSAGAGAQAQSPSVIPHGHEHFLTYAMSNYVASLKWGSRHIYRSLPRLLTRWFEWTEHLHSAITLQRGAAGADAHEESAPRRKGRSANARAVSKQAGQASTLRQSGGGRASPEEKLAQHIDITMRRAHKFIAPFQWYTVLPQLASRICHPSPDVVSMVQELLTSVLYHYPRQAAWSLTGLCKSLNQDRRRRAKEVRTQAQERLRGAGKDAEAAALDVMEALFSDLCALARAIPPAANVKTMPVSLDLQRRRRSAAHLPAPMLLPLQSLLRVTLPAPGKQVEGSRYDAATDAFPSDVHIVRFHPSAAVMHSKERPKKLTVDASDGRTYSFLCKREDRGDLRKDARVMEFNQVVNRLLQADAEGRRRALRLRTYAVICLSEDTGLLQWVPNTTGMRHLISACQKKLARRSVRLTQELKAAFENMQRHDLRDAANHARILRQYRHVRSAFPICFHRWFVEKFSTPSAWFDARLAFARSAAVWSMVGYVVGLGDRHGENILIDQESGECVHVDFDCLFDKGLQLARPEIVPFRLTPNMLDAFGLCGAEGVFRRSCEHTLQVLRANRPTLTSVLETFVHDPCVEWSAARHASRSRRDPEARTEADEAKRILRTIDTRLRGVFTPRALTLKERGGTAAQDELHLLPLSINGQVERLLKEASSELNLSQMYIGWMPFL